MDNLTEIKKNIEKSKDLNKEVYALKNQLYKELTALILDQPTSETFNFICENAIELVADSLLPSQAVLSSIIAQEFETKDLKLNPDIVMNYSLKQFLLLITQNLVLRNKPLPDWVPGLYTREPGNAIGKVFTLQSLPLKLLDIESDPSLTSFGYSGSGSTGLARMSGNKITDFGDTKLDLDYLDKSQSDQILSVVYPWTHNSNGRYILQKFTENSPKNKISKDTIKWISKLFDSKDEDYEITISSADLKSIYSMLFSAANNGGAYGRGVLGATARLLTWQSISGLCELEIKNLEQIKDFAEKCEWYLFESKYWFYNVAWDFGIICIRPDRSYIVFAATDTD